MTVVAKKKQRYEGLIQFQDPLRQALVCLQAALAERFTTGAQLEFLKQKDTPDASHFLLTSDGSNVGGMGEGLEARHLLMRVEQLDQKLPTWDKPECESKIAAWLDSSDTLAAQYIFQLLAQAVAITSQFDLQQVSSWGAETSNWQGPHLIQHESWQSLERRDMLKTFQDEAAPLFKKIDKQNLTTDGCSVTLHIEGPTDLSWQDLSITALERLVKPNRHLIAVNYISQPTPRLQIAYITPMRLPLKDLQASTLKGFMLLRDIKEAAKVAKSVLAS